MVGGACTFKGPEALAQTQGFSIFHSAPQSSPGGSSFRCCAGAEKGWGRDTSSKKILIVLAVFERKHRKSFTWLALDGLQAAGSSLSFFETLPRHVSIWVQEAGCPKLCLISFPVRLQCPPNLPRQGCTHANIVLHQCLATGGVFLAGMEASAGWEGSPQCGISAGSLPGWLAGSSKSWVQDGGVGCTCIVHGQVG